MTKKTIWLNKPKNKKNDLKRLMPKEDGKKDWFETVEEVYDWNSNFLNQLSGYNEVPESYLEEITSCSENGIYCGHYCCRICSRKFRRWYVGHIFEAVKHYQKSDLQVLTAYIKDIPAGKLHLIELAKFKQTLQRQLTRSGFKHVLGNLELAFNVHENIWHLHAHLLLIAPNSNAIKQLKKTFKKKEGSRLLKFDSIKDKPEAISYAIKYPICHRPGEQIADSRSRMFLLPNGPLGELARWTMDKRFSDFLILVGARRSSRGIQINGDH
jgi:hypothetical protein